MLLSPFKATVQINERVPVVVVQQWVSVQPSARHETSGTGLGEGQSTALPKIASTSQKGPDIWGRGKKGGKVMLHYQGVSEDHL